MKKRPILANETAAGAPETVLSNQFAILQRDELRVPYGDHPHPRGIQRLTKETATGMVDAFNSMRGRLARSFGGLPIYKGHPDDPDCSDRATDDSAYGWVMGMAAEPEALVIKCKWSADGEALLANARYKFFSPRWAVERLGTAGGRPLYAPLALVSVGLTNRPQIPVEPLANDRTDRTDRTEKQERKENAMEKLLTLLNATTEDEAVAAVEKMKTDHAAALANAEAAAKTSAETLANEAKATADKALADETAEREKLANELKAERAARIELLVNAAVLSGRITPAEKPEWTTLLSADFAGNSAKLANKAPAIKTEAKTAGLAGKSPATGGVAAQILTLVNERLEKRGWSRAKFADAWLEVKRERPELFGEVKK